MPASFVASGKCFSAVVPLWHGSLQCSNSQLSACARHAQSQQSEAQVTKLWMLEPAGRHWARPTFWPDFCQKNLRLLQNHLTLIRKLWSQPPTCGDLIDKWCIFIIGLMVGWFGNSCGLTYTPRHLFKLQPISLRYWLAKCKQSVFHGMW